MPTWGVHVPNSWDGKDKDKLLALGCSHFTLLDGEAWFVPALRQASPQGIILVRFYLPKWPDADPSTWAERCAAEYTRDRGGWTLRSMGCHVTPANEMNLEEEGGGSSAEWYARIRDWCLIWHSRFTGLVPGVADRLHFPAFAYGHSDDDSSRGYCGEEICRPAIERYAIYDKHPYWFEPDQITSEWYGHRFILSHQRFPTKPMFLSEAGNFNVTRESAPAEMVAWFKSLSIFPYVLGGTPFIFRDPTGAHSPNNWGRNLAIEQAVHAAIAAGGGSSGGGTVPTPTPTPAKLGEYARWALARIQNNEDPRDVAAFVAHLRALGAEYTAPESYGLPTVKVLVPKA